MSNDVGVIVGLVERDTHGHLWTTSLIVAEKFGKRHDDVLKAIQNLQCSQAFNLRNFAEINYLDPRGRKQPMYRISRDGFAFLAMGFTGREAAEWKEQFIEAFNRLEQSVMNAASLSVSSGFDPRITDLLERQTAVSELLVPMVGSMRAQVVRTEQKVEKLEHKVIEHHASVTQQITELDQKLSRLHLRKDFSPKTKNEWLNAIIKHYKGTCPGGCGTRLIVNGDWNGEQQFAHLEDRNKAGRLDGMPLCKACHKRHATHGKTSMIPAISTWVTILKLNAVTQVEIDFGDAAHCASRPRHEVNA